jgi:signal transduction histidine kinase
VVTLESSKLFQQLAPEELSALRAVSCEKAYAAGQEVFPEGGVGDGLYVIKSGRVDILARVGHEQTMVTVASLGPGDFFGEMAVLDYKRRSGEAVAAEETFVYFIPRLEILRFIERSPVLAMTLLREISNRLRDFSQQYVREVVQAERLALVGRFAQAIIHDLKNPLNVIGLSAELASLPQTAPEARKHALSVVRRQVDRISDLIGDVLDFTRGPTAPVALLPMPYGPFVVQVVEDSRAEATLKSVNIHVEGTIPNDLVALTPKRLSRVFANLFHNSMDFMPDGGDIMVRGGATDKELVTEVEDTGPGIAPEVATRLFEPFATHGKSHGTGLGLSICRRIVEDHGGWIKSVSQPGRGALFRFGLPRWDASQLPKSSGTAAAATSHK